MANADAAFGLRPVRYRSGAPYNGAANRYYIPATDTDAAAYLGALVKLAGSADADGVATVTANVATGDVVIGVVVGVEPVTHESKTFRENSTARYVYVADDPGLVFICQEDSVGGALAATNVGNSADLAGFTAGSTSSGRSTIEIDSSTATTGAGDQDVQVLGLWQSPDNEIGDNAVWEVRLLNHMYAGDASGV